MTVGNRIKERRLALGMTQEDLATKMGYKGKTSVCAAEKCGDNITTTKVHKFADALDCTFHYLMGYEDEFGNPIEIEHKMPELDARARRIIEYYKNLTPEMQDSIENLLINSQPKS